MRRRVLLRGNAPDSLVAFLQRRHDLRILAREADALELVATWDPDAVILVLEPEETPFPFVDRARAISASLLLIGVGAAVAPGWQLAFDYVYNTTSHPRELQAILDAWRRK